MHIAAWLAQSRAATETIAVDTAAVRRAIAAVFADDAYDRSLRETLWTRAWQWLLELAGDIVANVGESPPLRWALLAASALVVAALAARVAYLATAHTRGSRRRRHAAPDPSVDPLVLARAAASGGRFLEAAHFLYVAILEELRRRERLLLHPSKTLGEYRRDLAARSSAAQESFRVFTSAYEAIVWGRRSCDEAAYGRLIELAAPLIPRAPGMSAPS